MKRVWSFSIAACAAGMLILSGCGGADEAPEKKSESEETTTSSVEPSTKDGEAATEIAVNKEESTAAEPELKTETSNEYTLDDFKGFLPDDPIETLELTAEEEKYASMGPPPSEGEKIKQAGFTFQKPERLMFGDEYIKVDAPGYACPTIADVDDDGKMDLVVGQFSSGKMRLFRNVSVDSDLPRYSDEEWIKSGDKTAEVPGVW